MVIPSKGESACSYDTAIPCLDFSLEKPKDTHTKICLEYFVIAKRGKLFNHLAVRERIKYMEAHYTVESYPAFKINKSAPMWVNLKNKKKNHIYIFIHSICKCNSVCVCV